MKTPKQTGFSIVVLLVVFLVIAAVAGAGWVVYQRAKPNAMVAGQADLRSKCSLEA